MKVEWINPFLAARGSIFDHLKVKWQRGMPFLVQAPLPLNGITSDIDITGDVQGKFLLSCPMDSALMLANQFGSTFGMPPSIAFEDMQRSAFSEIANLIGGKTAASFSRANLQVNISPPSLMEGEHLLSTIVPSQMLKIPFTIEDKETNLYVALN